jgi:hypothetical protein
MRPLDYCVTDLSRASIQFHYLALDRSEIALSKVWLGNIRLNRAVSRRRDMDSK